MTPTRPPRANYRQSPALRRTRHGYIDAPVLAPHSPEVVTPRLEHQHDDGGVNHLQFRTPQNEDEEEHLDEREHEELEGEDDLEEEEDEDEEAGIEEGAYFPVLFNDRVYGHLMNAFKPPTLKSTDLDIEFFKYDGQRY